MSLLMDALKRAERVREAKERSGGMSLPALKPTTDDTELSLDPVDLTTPSGGLALEPVSEEQGINALEFVNEPALDNTDNRLDMFKPPDGSGQSDSGIRYLNLQLEDSDLEDSWGEREDSLEVELPPIVLGGSSTGDSFDPSSTEAEDTSATLPSIKIAKASVDSYFDGTDSVTFSIENMEPDTVAGSASDIFKGPEAGEVTSRLGEEEADPRHSAQRVFDAKVRPASGPVARTLVFVALPLLLVAGGIGGVLFWVSNASTSTLAVSSGGPQTFYDSVLGLLGVGSSEHSRVPRARLGVAPQNANANPPLDGQTPRTPVTSVEQQGTAPAVATNADTVTTQPPTNAELVRRARLVQQAQEAVERGASAVAAEDTGSRPLPGASVPEQGDLSVQPLPPKIIEAPTTAAVAAPKQTSGGGGGGRTASSDDKNASVVNTRTGSRQGTHAGGSRPNTADGWVKDQQGGDFESAIARTQAKLPQGPVVPGTISIASRSKVDRVSPALQRAYAAYERGELAQAARSYRDILSTNPNQRDALLGGAAVAARQGRLRAAREMYTKLLALNPKDSVARSALLTITPSGDAQTTESEYKIMLAEEPDAHHLHYGLGNLYAAQGRWPEAQAAYFDAFRHDASHPDYAFNLAVSLDHMRQHAAALNYYKQALVLAELRDPGFDVASARSRIDTMNGSN